MHRAVAVITIETRIASLRSGYHRRFMYRAAFSRILGKNVWMKTS
jgi:hypothetical protein